MGALQNTCQANADAALADLAGVEFHHDLRLAVPDWAAWSDISKRLHAAGADIQALYLARSEHGFSVRCRLRHVSEAVARTLVRGWLDEGLAQRGDVEHLVLARADVAL